MGGNLKIDGSLVNPQSFSYGNVGIGSTADNIFIASDNTVFGSHWTHALSGPDAAAFFVFLDNGAANSGHDGSIGVRFSPTGAATYNAVLTLTGDMLNSPFVINLSGVGTAAGYLTLTPQTTNNFGNVKDGTTSGPLNILLQNNSGTDVIVSAIAFNGDFAAGGALPGLPFTQHANHADSAVIIPVQFTPSFMGYRLTANALVVTSSASNSPTNQAMQGTGVIITPAYTVPVTPLAVLMAFALNGVVTVLRMNADDLNCEEAGSFKRIYDWGIPLMEKYLGRVIARYQDESVIKFNVSCTANLTRTPTSVVSTLTNQGGANDGLIHDLFFDIQQSDDLIQIVIARNLSDGPLVITEMFHEIDPRGEFIPT